MMAAGLPEALSRLPETVEAALPRDAGEGSGVCSLSLDEDPAGLQQRKGDEPDRRGAGHEQRVADLPAEQDDEPAERDEGGQPVADGDLAEEDAGAGNGADRRGVGALDEAFDVG